MSALDDGLIPEWQRPGGRPIPVVVTNLDISFVNLVVLLVKVSLAAVPAVILLAIFWVLLSGLLALFGVVLF